ncbi:RsmE family RNA methyltransferase [Chloroflexota bacterium]
MHRFFVAPQWIDQDNVVINGKQVHQLRDVLRMKPGDCITVLDNTGWEYDVELKRLTRDGVEGMVRGKSLAAMEPGTKITLYQALLKGNKMEFILQKCTELGVVGFVPMLCERCVHLRLMSEGKLSRWRRIIGEAAEQSQRGKLPFLKQVLTFEQACQSALGPSLLAWEGDNLSGLSTALTQLTAKGRSSVNLFIGPEGGFSSSEVGFAQDCGVTSFTLGRRILRAETASLVATAAILYEYGDLDIPD